MILYQVGVDCNQQLINDDEAVFGINPEVTVEIQENDHDSVL